MENITLLYAMKWTVALIVIFLNLEAFSQEENNINTDRPDQSDGTYVLPKRTLQIESGLLFTKEADLQNMWTHSSMFRYGLLKKLELRLIVEEAVRKDKATSTHEYGLLPLQLSSKFSITEQKGFLPSITAVGYLTFPHFASKKFHEDKYSTFLLVAFENSISEKFSIGYNTGIRFNEDKISEQYVFTTSLAFSFSDKLGTFLEYFGNYHKGTPDNNIDAGILILLEDNFQLDFAGGIALNSLSRGYFITAGFSYRF